MKHKFGTLFREEFFGAPYRLGGQSKDRGFDCISLVFTYYKKLEKNFPDLWDLYPLYKSKPKKALKTMWKRIFKATDDVPLGQVQVGDLIIFEHHEFGNYPGICLGNGVVGVVFTDRGVITLRYEALKVLYIRRCKD